MQLNAQRPGAASSLPVLRAPPLCGGTTWVGTRIGHAEKSAHNKNVAPVPRVTARSSLSWGDAYASPGNTGQAPRPVPSEAWAAGT